MPEHCAGCYGYIVEGMPCPGVTCEKPHITVTKHERPPMEIVDAAPCPACAGKDESILVGLTEIGARDAEIARVTAERDALRAVGREMAGIGEAVEKARAKFPTWPSDPLHALGVVSEEFGELSQAIVQCIYEGGDVSNVKKEALHLAAVALRFVASLDRYSYARCEQHDQSKWRSLEGNQ